MNAYQEAPWLSKLAALMLASLIAVMIFCGEAYAEVAMTAQSQKITNEQLSDNASGVAYNVSSVAAQSYAYSWSYSNGVLTLSAYTGTKSDFPAKYVKNNSERTVAWPNEPFTTVMTSVISSDLKSVTKLVIGGGIKKVSNTFVGKFPNLETVVIESSVEKIEAAGVFSGLVKLSKVDFSNATSLKSLATRAFSGCASLKELDLSNTAITEMGNDLETGCILCWSSDGTSALEKLVCPKNLLKVGQSAFVPERASSSLKTVVLWDKVESIGQDAFMNCVKLETVYVPSTLKSINTNQLRMGTENNNSTASVLSGTNIVVYPVGDTINESALDIEKCTISGLKEVGNGQEGSSQPTAVFPGKAVYLANALDSVGNNAEAIQNVIEADEAFKSYTDAHKAAPYWTTEFWKGIRAKIDNKAEAIWEALLETETATSTADKLKLFNSLMSSKNEEISKLEADVAAAQAAREKAESNYHELWSRWDAASNSAAALSSQKAKLETELKEAKTKLEEAQKKVEDTQAQLDAAQSGASGFQEKLTALQAEVEKEKAKADESQKKAEETQTKLDEVQAKVVALQDKLAVSALKGEVKTVKLNKKGRTAAKATIKLKLATSESGAAVACAKAKGTGKGVSVSKAGVITLAKGSKKGTYKAVVTFTCGKASKTVTYTFKAA